jgi:hypothetical protein
MRQYELLIGQSVQTTTTRLSVALDKSFTTSIPFSRIIQSHQTHQHIPR